MSNILICKEIKKNYNSNKVIENFTYTFASKGLYSIYGDSGSGKTTLLNIINGNVDFDDGEVYIYNKNFKKKVNTNFAKQTIAYITQNCYFIDYLNVYDNLKLCLDKGQKVEKINLLLKKFNLQDKKKNFSKQLSGGELQRLSLVVALLQNKKIIILDEPTSSLDEKNAKLLISILEELKNTHLIICATHDLLLIESSDKKININDSQGEYKDNNLEKYSIINTKKRLLFPYMLKKNKLLKNNKSSIILVIVLTFVLLVFNLCYDGQTKIQQTLLEYNKINFVNYNCNVTQKDHCDSILKKYNATKNMYLYANNNPMETNGVEFELTARTLPFDEELFPKWEERILYGKYYENENDLIVGYEYAKKKNNNIEELIGSTVDIRMPDKVESFRIVGIFKDIEEDAYLISLTNYHALNREIYLNDKYIKKYEYDGIPKMFEVQNGVVSMRAYFNNRKDLKSFYDESSNTDFTIIKYDSNFVDFNYLIRDFDYYLKPAIIIAFIVALVFFYEIENIYNKKKGYILSVYKYYGYSYLKIALAYFVSSIIYSCALFFISFVLSAAVSYLLNYVILKFNIIYFKLFIIDYLSAFKLCKYLIFISVILVIPIILNQIRKGWLKTIKEGEDFI